MNRLLAPDDLEAARVSAARVFRAIGTGASQPFRDELSHRLLIYPIDYTMLTSEQFGAVSAGAARLGDTRAFVVSYGTLDAGWAGTYEHRSVDLSDYSDYRSAGGLVLEHLLYSPSRRWGVVTSDGGEAVVGGSAEFVDEIRSRLTESDEAMANAFVRDQQAIGQGGGNIDWLQPLLRHTYGRVKAEELLSDDGDPRR